MLPLLGQIAAGAPLLAEGQVEELLPVPELLTASGENFLLRVRGESMIDDGIHNGDYVVVRRQDTAEDGEIIAALVDGGEATVKRIYREERSHPAAARQCVDGADLRRRRRRARPHRRRLPEDSLERRCTPWHSHTRPWPTRSPTRSRRRGPRRCAQARSAGRCLVCGGLTRIATHAGVRSASCVECESVLEAPLPTRLRLVSHRSG